MYNIMCIRGTTYSVSMLLWVCTYYLKVDEFNSCRFLHCLYIRLSVYTVHKYTSYRLGSSLGVSVSVTTHTSHAPRPRFNNPCLGDIPNLAQWQILLMLLLLFSCCWWCVVVVAALGVRIVEVVATCGSPWHRGIDARRRAWVDRFSTAPWLHDPPIGY